MSANEQEDLRIGKAHRELKEARKNLQRLETKAQELVKAIQPVLEYLQNAPRFHDATVFGQLQAYPASADVLQTIEEIRLCKETIEQLERILA